MSHSNSTQYYSLPQFDSTDKPAWLVDVNPAYAAIDAGIHAAKAAADSAQGDATQALSDASSAGTAASGADAKAAGSIASLADTFDATATYNIGDLVIYNSLLYICIIDVAVPGPWTGSGNWNRTTMETEINKKQSMINELTSVSTLNDTDEIAIYDGTNTKKTTAADVASLGNTCDTLYNKTTYQNDIGTSISISGYDFRDYRIVRITVYAGSYASIARGVITIPNCNSPIFVQYIPISIGGAIGAVRFEGTNNSVTLLSVTSDLGSSMMIGEIMGIK